MDRGENLCFARLHYQEPPALVDFVARYIKFSQSGGLFAGSCPLFTRFFMQLQGKIARIIHEDIFGYVRLYRSLQSLEGRVV